jgi:hypothetical protein
MATCQAIWQPAATASPRLAPACAQGVHAMGARAAVGFEQAPTQMQHHSSFNPDTEPRASAYSSLFPNSDAHGYLWHARLLSVAFAPSGRVADVVGMLSFLHRLQSRNRPSGTVATPLSYPTQGDSNSCACLLRQYGRACSWRRPSVRLLHEASVDRHAGPNP